MDEDWFDNPDPDFKVKREIGWWVVPACIIFMVVLMIGVVVVL